MYSKKEMQSIVTATGNEINEWGLVECIRQKYFLENGLYLKRDAFYSSDAEKL